MVSSKIICAKERESTLKVMALSMMATLSMDRLVVLEFILALTAIVMKDLGRPIYQMDLERLSTEMDQFTRVIWCKENVMEGDALYRTAAYTKESSDAIK